MSAMASQIASLTIVYSIVYSGADQRKHESSASLAFVRVIHRSPVNSPHKGPVTRKMFSFDDVIMEEASGCWWPLMSFASWHLHIPCWFVSNVLQQNATPMQHPFRKLKAHHLCHFIFSNRTSISNVCIIVGSLYTVICCDMFDTDYLFCRWITTEDPWRPC